MNYRLLIWLISLIGYSQVSYGLEGRPVMRRACLNRLDSTLSLLWFKPSDNCGSFISYSLYGRDNTLGVFNRLYTGNSFAVNNLDIKLPKLKSWEFFLVYNTTCDGLDSLYSDTISIDNSPPFNSSLDSVSVDLLTQEVIIGWSANSSPDVKGYIVYHVTGSNSVIANTGSTNYRDNGPRNPGNGQLNYSVAAFDSCDNASLISDPHRTIHTKFVYDQCSKTIALEWEPYSGWQVDRYEIYRKINSGNYQLVGTVVSNIDQFTYNFSQFGDNYCFFIRAIKVGGLVSSSSNVVCVSTAGIVASKNSYVAKASVQNEEVELTLVVQPGSSVQKINIYKAENNGNFNLWQSIASTGGVLELKDPDVYVQTRNYSFYFTTEGPCGLIFDTSQISKTIVLSAIMLAPGDQEISWSLYKDFIKQVSKQELLLSDNKNFNKSSPWNVLNSYNNTVTTSKDQTEFGPLQEQICYCVRAIENNPSAQFTRQDTSYSNIQCLTADPVVYFPNAIQINGFNTSFMPKGAFLDYDKSSFQIYNRWGEIIYETNDIRKAWFGTFNDAFVESDVYAYKAIIVGLNGKVLTFDGTITVLK